MQTAAFGSKTFQVSANKIMTPDNISISEDISFEQQEVYGKKPSTYIKGQNEMKISFDVYLDARFCSINDEFNWWLGKMRSGQAEFLSIGKKAWGTNKFLIASVNISNIHIMPDGMYSKAKLSLSFSEYVRAGQKKES